MITTSPYGQGVVRWVSTEWLADHLDDKRIAVLDCQPNVHDYIQEHIPGAVYFNENLLRVPFQGRPAVYVEPEVVQHNLRRVGLTIERPVVVYTGSGPFKGWGDGLEQTMVAYTLARFGLDRVYVLDGGVEKWKAENRPLTKEFPEVEGSDMSIDVRRDYFIDLDEFKRLKKDPDTLVLDARPPNVYEGQGPWSKPGHIPGAVNLPWKSLMDPDNPRLLKPLGELEELVTAAGASVEKTIICSCGTGREATNEFLLFKWFLGFPRVRIYEGSFTEWSADPANPTVTGPEPG